MGYENRLCYQRVIERKQKIHRDRVLSMKSTAHSNASSGFDNRAPPSYDHLRTNVKKRQMYNDELNRIAKSNTLLEDRMSSIKSSMRPTSAMEFIPGVRLGLNQNPVVDCYLSNSTVPSRGCAVLKQSLNIEARTKEHDRIAYHNRKFFDRLKSIQPYYNASHWEQVCTF